MPTLSSPQRRVLSESKLQDFMKRNLEKMRGKEESFLRKIHANVGTEGLLDMAVEVLSGTSPERSKIAKETLLWLGVPAAGGVAAHAMGLPIAMGLLFKSAVWITIIQLLRAFKKGTLSKRIEKEESKPSSS